MTPKAKIAVTLPADLVESARAAVHAGRAGSVSAYVAGALRQRADAESLDDLLVSMLAETGGPLTDDERREIDEDAGWR